MYVETKNVEQHFRDTEKLVRAVKKNTIASWLLKNGYFPESNILPPTFISNDLSLMDEPYNKDVKSLARRKLTSISYPKTLLSSRQFSIQHPWNYHDVIYYLMQEWDDILDTLYSKDLKIYSYSMPIPVTKSENLELSKLRSGRMIYEWISMAENDLVLDATYFKFIAKTDIANFYSSIYTHSIAWAIEGREKAFADKEFTLNGNKIDRLIQYANDARTNGIPVGSALSDFISEIVLSVVDTSVSKSLKQMNFVAVRFKDDYRVLCQSEEDAKTFLKVLSQELSLINLSINEKKTTIESLPHGLYRKHDRMYFPHSLKERNVVSFKTFEHTLLIALDVHREFQGTSILEKYFSELLDRDNKLKLKFSDYPSRKLQQIKKFYSLLFLAKRESEKLLSQVLSLVELVYLNNKPLRVKLKGFLKEIVKTEVMEASKKGSAFEIVWYIFFSRYLSLGITNFAEIIDSKSIQENQFVQCMLTSQNKLYQETNIALFRKPSDCKGKLLVEHLDIFQKNSA